MGDVIFFQIKRKFYFNTTLAFYNGQINLITDNQGSEKLGFF